ncbi:MAG: hypothetical protein U0X76_02875 [Bacteroidia bacterium]
MQRTRYKKGLEETLTLHKLKVAQIFSRSLGTTNCIESLNSQMAKFVRNVNTGVIAINDKDG